MSLKTIVAAAIGAATLLLLPAASAEAKTRVTIGIGTPVFGGYYGPGVYGGYYAGGGYCWNHPWRCRPAPRPYPYYYATPRPTYYYDYAPRRPAYVGKLSCGRGAAIVDNSGFNHVYAQECRGSVYTYSAKRNNKRYIVSLNAFSGRIVGTSRY